MKEHRDEESYELTQGGMGITEVLPGKGSIDFKKAFSYIKRYTGDVRVELEGTEDEMRKSIEYRKSCFNEVK